MKNVLLIGLLFLMSCTSCKKEVKYPDGNLIGTWVSIDPVLQFPIKNTDGIGEPINFLKFTKDGKDYLKFTYPEGQDTYLIKHIGKKELFLIDTKDPVEKMIGFFRFE